MSKNSKFKKGNLLQPREQIKAGLKLQYELSKLRTTTNIRNFISKLDKDYIEYYYDNDVTKIPVYHPLKPISVSLLFENVNSDSSTPILLYRLDINNDRSLTKFILGNYNKKKLFYKKSAIESSNIKIPDSQINNTEDEDDLFKFNFSTFGHHTGEAVKKLYNGKIDFINSRFTFQLINDPKISYMGKELVYKVSLVNPLNIIENDEDDNHQEEQEVNNSDSEDIQLLLDLNNNNEEDSISIIDNDINVNDSIDSVEESILYVMENPDQFQDDIFESSLLLEPDISIIEVNNSQPSKNSNKRKKPIDPLEGNSKKKPAYKSIRYDASEFIVQEKPVEELKSIQEEKKYKLLDKLYEEYPVDKVKWSRQLIKKYTDKQDKIDREEYYNHTIDHSINNIVVIPIDKDDSESNKNIMFKNNPSDYTAYINTVTGKLVYRYNKDNEDEDDEEEEDDDDEEELNLYNTIYEDDYDTYISQSETLVPNEDSNIEDNSEIRVDVPTKNRIITYTIIDSKKLNKNQLHQRYIYVNDRDILDEHSYLRSDNMKYNISKTRGRVYKFVSDDISSVIEIIDEDYIITNKKLFEFQINNNIKTHVREYYKRLLYLIDDDQLPTISDKETEKFESKHNSDYLHSILNKK